MMWIQLIEWILYTYLSVSVGYIVLFAIASLFARRKNIPEVHATHRFQLLIPSYKEDNVILDTVRSALSQHYPTDLFHVLVISDHMTDATNNALRAMGAEVLEIRVKESSKSLALQTAVRHLESNQVISDYTIILDADNLIPSDFLEQVNQYVCTHPCTALQAHRTAKNLNTPTAILDAAIEEMNNSIFRLGHTRLGLSSALIGSGMVFNTTWFNRNIFHTHTAGEDKELEELLLRQKKHIHYADHIRVLDEKVQQESAMSNQRKRWIATQFFLASLMWKRMPQATIQGNIDYLVKAIQSIILPRSILVAFLGMLCIIITLIPFLPSTKWWVLLFTLLIAMYIAIPKELRGKQLYQALKEVPFFIGSMTANLFRSKGASKKFIHTSHGNA